MSLFSKHECKYIKKITKFSLKTSIKILISCGYLIFLIGLSIYNIFKYIYNIKFYQKHGFTYLQIYKKIYCMNGREFEKFMYYLLKTNGYKVKLTKSTNDGGKDLILWNSNKEKIYIELKRWSGDWKVGREVLQKLVGATVGDKANRCICITTSDYNANAREYANKIPYLQLWNMKNIMNLCKQIENKIPYIFSKCKIINNKDMFYKLKKYNDKINFTNKKWKHKINKLNFQNKYKYNK